MVEKKKGKKEGAEESTELLESSSKKSNPLKALSWQESEAETVIDDKADQEEEDSSNEDDDSSKKEEEHEEEEVDEIKPLASGRRSSLGASLSGPGGRRASRPSLTRQQSRYVDQIRKEDEAAHAGFQR
jgi:TATA-binding protein-associated factor Taf7